ncbi:low molecular weight phosphotyrosine protein phosphatase 1 isoform X2 [Drosophila willistoni]|uniref:low molecular weight phosphotyrosine protein phosphatase 1 isoform X2 n=1 Tax=Drosophila willistoni TaxID=7260 RepID=UPI000C26D494|nr:low molecular weight phosphotyrosine protein phosphatase 1 isoform X2 [Drosophila willistoni]
MNVEPLALRQLISSAWWHVPPLLRSACKSNTCRSPMAESVMEHLIQKHQLHDWHTDSAGLRDWNVGREPQGRAQHLLQQHGLKSRHLSRLITSQDFYDFDYILGMDSENLKELQQMANSLRPQPHCKILLLGSFLERKEDEIIPDPYFSQGMGGFHSAYLQINESCEAFVKKHRDDNNGS